MCRSLVACPRICILLQVLLAPLIAVAAAAAAAAAAAGAAHGKSNQQKGGPFTTAAADARETIVHNRIRRLSPEAERAVHQWRSRIFGADDDDDDDAHETEMTMPPVIQVDYGDSHPFDLYRRSKDQKHEQENEQEDRDLQTRQGASRTKYRPLRIHFETSPLESLRGRYGEEADKKIDFIITEVLPEAGKRWSDALSVVPINARFAVPRGSCGGAVTDAFTVSNSDVVMVVSSDVRMCREAVGAIAAAYPCAVDNYDRPIVGVINFCLGPTRPSVGYSRVGSERTRLVETALHEMAHLLGFVDEFMKFYRDGETGEPLTPRPFRYETVTCVDGTRRNVIKPPFLRDGLTSSGANYFEVTTPRVAQVVRNQFDCQQLSGARLETQPTSTSCFGSHLEERLYFTELMGAIYTDSSVLSALTLAFLEDTGWYKANYTNAATSTFGHRAGCAFVMDDCIVNGQVPAWGEDFFCNTPLGVTSQGTPLVDVQQTMCDPTRRKKAACDLIDRSELANDLLYGVSAELPAEYQYFPDESVGAASMPLADYCPIPAMEMQDCRDSSNSGQYEVFGKSSFCYTSYYRDMFGRWRSFSPLCLRTRCNADDSSIEIAFDGEKVTCGESDHGKMVKLLGMSLRISCPRFDVVCADLVCPANCSGKGICEKRDNDSVPKCKCFDEADESLGCFGSDSAITTGSVATSNEDDGLRRDPTPNPTRAAEQDEESPSSIRVMVPTHDPTQLPTYGYPDSDSGDRNSALDASPPTAAPSQAPVITLYADAWRQRSSASRSCASLIAFLCLLSISLHLLQLF